MSKVECAAPAPANQRELVRLLYLEHGHQKAAELSGVKYSLVRQWAVRGGWIEQRKQALSQSVTKQVADNVLSELAAHEHKTKLGLAKYASDKAQELAERGKLKDSGHFKNVAGGASIVHRWDAKADQSQNVIVNVALLGIQPDQVQAQAIDVDSGVSE